MPSMSTIPDGTTSTSPATNARNDSGMLASISSRMTVPRRRRLSALSYRRTRSSASSSTSMSLSRMTRNAPSPSTSYPGNSRPMNATINRSSITKRAAHPERTVRQSNKAFDASGNAHQRAHRLALLGIEEFERQRESQIGDERKRMRGIDRKRRQNRETPARGSTPAANLVRGGSDRRHRGLRCRWRRVRIVERFHRDCCEATNAATRSLMRSSCSAGVRPSSEISATPVSTWPTRPATRTMKNSSRLVGRDREEPQPLKQRMARVGGLLQHPPIELKPRQLAIDEALGRR